MMQRSGTPGCMPSRLSFRTIANLLRPPMTAPFGTAKKSTWLSVSQSTRVTCSSCSLGYPRADVLVALGPRLVRGLAKKHALFAPESTGQVA